MRARAYLKEARSSEISRFRTGKQRARICPLCGSQSRIHEGNHCTNVLYCVQYLRDGDDGDDDGDNDDDDDEGFDDDNDNDDDSDSDNGNDNDSDRNKKYHENGSSNGSGLNIDSLDSEVKGKRRRSASCRRRYRGSRFSVESMAAEQEQGREKARKELEPEKGRKKARKELEKERYMASAGGHGFSGPGGHFLGHCLCSRTGCVDSNGSSIACMGYPNPFFEPDVHSRSHWHDLAIVLPSDFLDHSLGCR